MKDIYLSVIVPVYNEEENLPILHKELLSALVSLNKKCEVLYIDDGSTDDSKKVLKKTLKESNTNDISFKIISFMRNYGQTAANAAGIKYADGKYVSFLDADLQNDPNDIPRFLSELKNGYDAVFGWRKNRKDKTLRSFASRMANFIIGVVFGYPFHDVGCSARVVKKEYLKDIRLYGELERILPVLIYLNGARITEIVVKHRERKMGKSKYGFERIIKILVDIITVKFLNRFATRPAYVFGSLGLLNLFIASFTTLGVIYKKLFLGVFVHKDPLFLITIFLILLGVQFIMMGLLAELQVRTYFESQDKDIYEVREIKKY